MISYTPLYGTSYYSQQTLHKSCTISNRAKAVQFSSNLFTSSSNALLPKPGPVCLVWLSCIESHLKCYPPSLRTTPETRCDFHELYNIIPIVAHHDSIILVSPFCVHNSSGRTVAARTKCISAPSGCMARANRHLSFPRQPQRNHRRRLDDES